MLLSTEFHTNNFASEILLRTTKKSNVFIGKSKKYLDLTKNDDKMKRVTVLIIQTI